MPFPFLTAHWKNLIVLNYEIDRELLLPYLPHGTELDDFQGNTFISIVAFYFKRNKLFGIIPTFPAVNFEEINLRFYVKRRCGEEIRRGVVFVKENVPSTLVATTARTIYNEPYEATPMQHDFSMFSEDDGGKILYEINENGTEIVISASTDGVSRALDANSIEHFILEHYWGYTKRKDGSTSEYRVEHVPWKYWNATSVSVSEKIDALYPPQFASILQKRPNSSFIAKGSPIAVYSYQKIIPRLNMQKAPKTGSKGWVLYDGACGFCCWWIPLWRKTIQACGFDIAPLQSGWVEETLENHVDQLNGDIRLLLSDGSLINGADAYIYGMKEVWWSRPMGLVLGFPGLRWLTWKFYKLFNRNRFFISKVCKLRPEDFASRGQ